MIFMRVGILGGSLYNFLYQDINKVTEKEIKWLLNKNRLDYTLNEENVSEKQPASAILPILHL